MRAFLRRLHATTNASVNRRFSTAAFSRGGGGLRIASDNSLGAFSAVGVLLRFGSRDECIEAAGASYVLSKMIVKQTAKRDAANLQRALEHHNAVIVANFTKDYGLLAGGSPRRHLPAVLALISEVLHTPHITDADVAEAAEIAAFEVEQMWRMHREQLLIELLHVQAFGERQLGNVLPVYAPNIAQRLTAADVQRHLTRLVHRESVVVCGVGVPNDEEFRAEAEKAFAWLPDPPPLHAATEAAFSWRGGVRFVREPTGHWPSHTADLLAEKGPATTANFHEVLRPHECGSGFANANADSHFTHVALGLRGASLRDDDIFALAVAGTLLGGGSSFSSGGPGKGMRSRLYEHVLNRFHWCDSAQSFSAAYRDIGMFGLHGACAVGSAHKMLRVFYEHLHGLQHARPDELLRAKNQTKAALLMGLDSRVARIEHVARAADCGMEGDAATPQRLCARIDAVAAEDVRRATQRLFDCEPAVLLYGGRLQEESREAVEAVHAALGFRASS